MVLRASSDVEGHSYFTSSKGIWVTYVATIALFHSLFMCLPFLSTASVWTVTNCIHGVITFIAFHYTKGTPYEQNDQGGARSLTVWEQLDHGDHFTHTKKFLTIIPIVMFLLATRHISYESQLFWVHLVVLAVLLVAKTPAFHQVRLFGWNKY